MKAMKRREFMMHAFIATLGVGLLSWNNAFAQGEEIKEITMSDEEWKKKLDPQVYEVLRREGTERAFTSPLLEEHRPGTFVCAGCGLPLFTSDKKFDSGTGWPSFFEAIPGHVKTKTDNKLFMPRTEYHCAQCGGHQGHVFNDGPQPTGLRYCNNGVSLAFKPEEKE
jgi:peptide-methionine (R)-S-oxide reductase